MNVVFSLLQEEFCLGECAFSATSTKEPSIESVENFVVTIEGGGLVLPSTYTEVALWKAVSAW